MKTLETAMRSNAKRLRAGLRFGLRTVGLLSTVQRFRSDRPLHQRLRQFARQHGNVLQHSLLSADHEPRVALVSSVGFPEVEMELALIKGLELAGFVPVVLIMSRRRAWLFRKYYSLAGVRKVHLWQEFADPPNLAAAEILLERVRSVQQLEAFEYEGSRVGMYAISTSIRYHRLGALDLQSPRDRQFLVRHLASGMAYAQAIRRVLERFHPTLAMLADKMYSPKGELFDHCLANGIDTIGWELAHKSNALMLKRFTLENRDEHPRSLSPGSWRLVKNMEWTDALHEQLQLEIYGNYASGDWYSISGTQFNKRLMDASAIQRRLGLSPEKKTAFIFPHISWDGTLFWGKPLFDDYEGWLIETVRAACANDQVNWVIKIHPAHVGKSMRDGWAGEPAEITSLRKHIGELPPHVFMIPAESDISTFSLFGLMDYCLTVRGSVGMEAARLGIPVLTAGGGAYDHKGFTFDSESREEYLEKIAHIQDIPCLSPVQQELAERFAYGIFVLRPLPLRTVTLKYLENGVSRGQVNVKTKEELQNAPDLRAFAQWVASPDRPEDFLMPLREKIEDPRRDSP